MKKKTSTMKKKTRFAGMYCRGQFSITVRALMAVTVLIATAFVAGGSHKNKTWVVTDNGAKVFVSPKKNVTYHWKGDVFDSLVNGHGVLIQNKKGKDISTDTLMARMGAVCLEDCHDVEGGTKYVGQFKSHKFEGYGVNYNDSVAYIGTFKKGVPSGRMKVYKHDSLYFSGIWCSENDSIEGYLHRLDGSWLFGTWKGEELFKTQVNQDVSNGHYCGMAKAGVPDGMGTMAYDFGGFYDGSWALGKWNGKGCYSFCGDSIDGQWKDGKLNGQGRYVTKYVEYQGEWLDGLPHGEGTYVAEGLQYTGQMKSGLMSGHGKISYANGDSYEGEWSNNLQNGSGVYTFADGSSYQGEWRNGKMNGEGAAIYPNGDYYLGTFHNGVKDGPGLYKFADGSSYEGYLTSGMMDSIGIFEFPDGNRYEGHFSKGKICGEGTMYINGNEGPMAVSACWNGHEKLPEDVSVIFGNGEVYEGKMKGGLLCGGKWYDELGTLVQDANQLYKSHMAEWNKAVHAIGNILVAVEISSIPLSFVPYIGPVMSVAGKVAHYANTVLYGTDLALTTASAGIDIYNGLATKDMRLVIGGLKNVGREVGFAVGVRLVPKVFKKWIMPMIKVLRHPGEVITIGHDWEGGGYAINIKKPTKVNFKTKTQKVFRSKYLRDRIKNSKLMKNLNAIKAKGAIKLSEEEIQALLDNPKDNIRAFIKAKTGSKNNFQEFFIRVAMHDPKVAKKLLDNPEIRRFVDRSIRRSEGGGNHEWLMTKNFSDFLTNPKWGEDGPFLALALTRFVQKTEKVTFKMGGSHHHENSGEFHNRLSEVIDRCNSAEELFLEIKAFAKKTLEKESYAEFQKAFRAVFEAEK